MNNNAVLAQLNTKNEVGLPIDPATFSKVILDFLGHKENLSYKSDDNFIINLEDIAQFNHLIQSKISYQKNIILDHISINFGYSDGTFREINGADSLEKFLETRSLEITSVNLKWKIIIKFDNNPTIETQEINLLFVTNLNNSKFSLGEEISYIELSINHTNQSWALDILNAFKDKINEITIKPNRLKKMYCKFKDNPNNLFLLIMVFFILSFSILVPTNTNTNIGLKQDLIRYTLDQNYKDDISKVVNLLHITTLEKEELKILKEKDKKILEIVENNNRRTYSMFALMFILAITPFLLKKYINYSNNYFNHKSFILVSKTSINNLKKYKQDKSQMLYIGFTLIVSSVLLSIIAAAFFKLIEKLIF